MPLPLPIRLAVIGLAALTTGCDRNGSDSVEATPSLSATLQAAPSGGTIDRSHKGSPMPDLVFSDPSGKQLRLAGLKGKPVLINLWATWCGPCVLEMPTLDKIAADNAAIVRVVTISQDATTPPVVQFFAQHGFTRLEPWLDPQGRIDIHYGTGLLPTSVYYDAEGREVWRLVGTRDWTSDDTTALLVEGTLQ